MVTWKPSAQEALNADDQESHFRQREIEYLCIEVFCVCTI